MAQESSQHVKEVRAILRNLVTAIGRPTTFNVQQLGYDVLGLQEAGRQGKTF